MCGLFGWQWKPGHTPNKEARKATASILAAEMDRRGGQSWGLFAPDLVMRGLGPSAPHSHRFSGLNGVFGHSRWATHGTNKLENTHPFIRDGVALAHNGVLSNHTQLNEANQRAHEVDSEHLLSHLLEAKPFTDIHGYGTICWFMPSTPECLYFARLDERGPLTVWEFEGGVVWASTREAVKEVFKANKWESTKDVNIEPGKALYAYKGEVFVDTEFPALNITTPSVVRDWSSYQTGSSTSGYTIDTSFSRAGESDSFWCNQHKKSYARCTCRGNNQSHIFKVTPAVRMTLKEGEMVSILQGEPGGAAARPTPPAPTSLRQLGYGDEFWRPHFCPAKGCTARWHDCIEHTASQLEWVQGYNETRARTQVETRREVQPAPEALVAELEAEEAEAAREAAIEELVLEFAKHWLEAEHEVTEAATNGMSPDEIVSLAMEMGFDVVDAELEAELAIDGEDYDESAEAEAGVQQSDSGDESPDGGEAGAVGAGPEVGPPYPSFEDWVAKCRGGE